MTAVKQWQRNKKKKIEGDVGAGDSRRPVNVAGERNALRQKKSIASRPPGGRRVATEAGDGPGKRANDTHELAAMFFFFFSPFKSTLLPGQRLRVARFPASRVPLFRQRRPNDRPLATLALI